MLPSWKYCSDDCRRLQTNTTALEKKHKKISTKKRKEYNIDIKRSNL